MQKNLLQDAKDILGYNELRITVADVSCFFLESNACLHSSVQFQVCTSSLKQLILFVL